MDLETLCQKIALPEELQREAFKFYHSDAFSLVKDHIVGLKEMKTEAAARKELNNLLGKDENRIKMLTCMLVCAAEQYVWYKEKGIPDPIFFATMGCFTRFIRECEKITGIRAFDREWWTARQLSGTLFRIGELEYEKMEKNSIKMVSIHIPSDSLLTKECCDQSIADAKKFFKKYFSEYSDAEYICDSWLLTPELSLLLPETSHILAFQKRFSLQNVDYSGTEYIEWVFKTRDAKTTNLPEETTLQKRMKQFLLDGGKVGSGFGILK